MNLYDICFRILTAREKRAREKFNSETELQAYEKRLKDVEQKIRSLDKHGKSLASLLTSKNRSEMILLFSITLKT